MHAVNGVSFDLAKGEVLGILGKSGSGKSVTLRSIQKLLPPRRTVLGGEILLDGKDVLKMPEKRLSRMRGAEVAMIFQEPATAFDPVYTDRRPDLRDHRPPRGGAAGRPRGRARWSSWSWCVSRPRDSGSTPIRTRCPAACASGR